MFENCPTCANPPASDERPEIPRGFSNCLLIVSLMHAMLSGCSMSRAGFDNLVVAPSQFRIHHDRTATERHHRQVARDALAARQAANPGHQISKDYADGFENGFVDYLTNGGQTAPPLLPPRGYWKLGQRSRTAHEAGQHWLNGATDGREHAAASGLRDFAVVPSTASVNAEVPVISVPDVPEALPLPNQSLPDQPLSTPDGATDRTGREILGRSRLSASP